MKQVIKGSVFDTSKASLVWDQLKDDSETPSGLYRTKSGKFFSYTRGIEGVGEKITPLDRLDVAMCLYEECGDPDIVKQVIGVAPEGEDLRQLSVKVSDEVYTLMRETAADQGASMAELVEKMAHRYCVPAFSDIPEGKFIDLLASGGATAREMLLDSQLFAMAPEDTFVLNESERELVANGIYQQIWEEIKSYDPKEDAEDWQGELIDVKQINLLFELNVLEKIWPGWIEDYDESCFEEEIDADEYDLIIRKRLREEFDICQKSDKSWDIGYEA